MTHSRDLWPQSQRGRKGTPDRRELLPVSQVYLPEVDQEARRGVFVTGAFCVVWRCAAVSRRRRRHRRGGNGPYQTPRTALLPPQHTGLPVFALETPEAKLPNDGALSK